MRSVKISALESYLPAELVGDEDLARMLGMDVPAVSAHSRGRIRYHSPDGEGPAAMAAQAARRLLEGRGLPAAEVGLTVFATNTPDMWFPGSACLLNHLLDAAPNASLDVRAQCSGFLYAIDVARRFVMTGSYERVMVAAADTSSHVNRYDGQSPELACLAGDGAAVALLEAGDGDGEILACELGNDGSGLEDYWCEVPVSRRYEGGDIKSRARIRESDVREGRHFPKADRAAMSARARAQLPGAFSAALAGAGVEAVDATLIAHLYPEVEDEIGAALGAAAGRLLTPALAFTGGASLPLLLHAAIGDGRLRRGQSVALLTAGAGASWGAAVLRTPS